jgi:hypothetical protein
MSPSRSRHKAFFTLGAFLIIACPAYGQDKPDAKSVVAKINEGAGLARIKEMLAASPTGARFRVDGFSLTEDGKSIKVSGAMLVPGANDKDRMNAAKQTRNKVIEAVQKVANVEKFEEFDFDSTAGTGSVKEVRGERLPQLLLQKAANKAGETNPATDELKLTDARFDTTGHLVLIGVKGSKPETEKWLSEAIPTILAENAAAIGPNEKLVDADGKQWVLTDRVELFNKSVGWPVSAAAVQRALIHKLTPARSRFRVDRVYFVSSPGKVDEANPTGVNWEYALSGIVIGTDPPDAKAIAKVCDEVFVEAKWGQMKSGNLEGLTKADFRVPDPGPKFQKAIAAIPALDGVRVDDLTEFGEDGRLLLTGLQPGLDEQNLKELTTVVVQVLNGLATGSDGNALYRQLPIRGISIRKMDRIKVRDLYAELRKWVAEKLDDIRLTRFYFNEEGQLTLICDTPPSDSSDRALVEKELKTRLANYKFPSPSETAPPAREPIVKTGPNPFKGSLSKHLQKMVTDSESTKWTAVLIERGFFNEANQYTVLGVTDTEEQKKQLIRYIDSLKSDPEWSAYFKVPEANPELEVIPMTQLVERVQRVTPAYSLFDGMRITGAKYAFIKNDKSGFADGLNLVFTAHVFGKPNLYECRLKLANLISKHPSYSRRLAKTSNDKFPRLRIEEVPMPPVPEDHLLSQFTTGFGASNLVQAQAASSVERKAHFAKAKEWIDAGLMHSPDQSSIWFLSAYLHYITGDVELTRRDLYRTIEIEDPLAFNGGDQRRRRYDIAKDLQGEKRDELEKLWLECVKEIKSGAKPMTMVPAK